MSKATTTDPSKEYESANGNSVDKSFGDTEVVNKDEGEEGEESDEYEEIDDEEIDEDEGEGEGVEQQSTLTHLLIGKPNGAENEAEYEKDDEDEGDDDNDDNDEDEDEDDEDEEYVEEELEDEAAHSNSLNKKRSIDEVADKEAQGSKKIKAWQLKAPGALA